MLLVEFDVNLNFENGVCRLNYKEVNEENWHYLYVDIETLNLLLQNYGIISTIRTLGQPISIDNYTTSSQIIVKYCGCEVNMFCRNKDKCYLPILEQHD